MSRAFLVIALLAGLAYIAWDQSVPDEAASTAPNSLVHSAAPSKTLPGPVWRITTPFPGTRIAAMNIATASMGPVSSVTWLPHGDTTSGILQTSYFESTEPLPPGVDYPEGPQLWRTTQRDAAVAPATNGAAPPLLLPPQGKSREPDSAENDDQFVALFNGSDLAGWHVQEGKPEAWSVVDGAIRCDRSNGGWLRTTQEFSDFEVRFDVRLSAGANTGVGLRFPGEGSPTRTGIELQLIDESAPKYADLRDDQYTGSLYYQLPPLQRQAIPVGEWVPVQVVVRGPRIRATIGGVVVTDVYLDQLPGGDEPHPLRQRPAVGYVGLQSSGSPVEFRRLRIHDLTTPFDSGLKFIDLQVGTGEICPAGAQITVEYRGCRTDGVEFDSSYGRGEPLSVRLDDVIAGWQAGIPGMRVGGRRKLVVPAALAYGDAGVQDLIPPGATLVFEVELRAVER